MSIVNVITITLEEAQDQKKQEVALRLLEKWYFLERKQAVGTWVVDGGCYASGPFPSLPWENRTWNYNPVPKSGLLTIGHSVGPKEPFKVHPDSESVTNSLGLDPYTYVALLGIRRTASGKFQAVSDESPQTGLFYPPGKPPTPVTWESEWGLGLYPCPKKWVWDSPRPS